MTLVKTGLALLVGMTVLSTSTYATNAQIVDLADVHSLPTHPVSTNNALTDLGIVLEHINSASGTLGAAVANLDAAIGGPSNQTSSARVSVIQDLLQPSVPLITGITEVNQKLGGAPANAHAKVVHLQKLTQSASVTLNGCINNANAKLGGAGFTSTVAKIDHANTMLGGAGTTAARIISIKALSNGTQPDLYNDINDKVARLHTWINAKIVAGTPIPAFTGPLPTANLEGLIAYLQAH